MRPSTYSNERSRAMSFQASRDRGEKSSMPVGIGLKVFVSVAMPAAKTRMEARLLRLDAVEAHEGHELLGVALLQRAQSLRRLPIEGSDLRRIGEALAQLGI